MVRCISSTECTHATNFLVTRRKHPRADQAPPGIGPGATKLRKPCLHSHFQQILFREINFATRPLLYGSHCPLGLIRSSQASSRRGLGAHPLNREVEVQRLDVSCSKFWFARWASRKSSSRSIRRRASSVNLPLRNNSWIRVRSASMSNCSI
jgi:hypothetical protein